MLLAEAPPVPAVRTSVRGFGGGAGADVLLVRPADADEARAAVAWYCSRSHDHASGAIARGLGRSYGDAAQLAGGYVLDTTRIRGFELDDDAGTVTASAGATIGQLIAALVPAGWMLPVVPGTKHVTVGGAIASDVHGKNHPSAGSFGAHVCALGLVTAAGELVELVPTDAVFAATIGGMGLTGVILWARIRLKPVSSDLMAVDVDRVRCLDDALALLSARTAASHRIAWLDLLASTPGRGIITSSEHEPAKPSPPTKLRRPAFGPLTVPVRWPAGVLRAASVRVFNELRYRRAPLRERGRPQDMGGHMFPLDGLNEWPRLYGSGGLLQYQFVVPHRQERALEAVIAVLVKERVPCFLATLKALGAGSCGPVSFPLAGWTLALDIPRAAIGVERLLDRLDEIVAEAGGRVYLTKDARLGPDMLSAMYPRLAEWQSVRDSVDPERAWCSDLAVRTGLLRGGRE